MKKYGHVMVVTICVAILITSMIPIEKEYDTIIVGVTGHKYEWGIKVSADNTVVSGIIFRDIAIGICVWGSNTTIRDCLFINCSDEGVVIFPTSQGSTIEDCIFIECCDGIELQQAHNTTIQRCEFIRNWHTGIDIIGEASYNVSIIDCEFEDNRMDIFDLQR